MEVMYEENYANTLDDSIRNFDCGIWPSESLEA